MGSGNSLRTCIDITSPENGQGCKQCDLDIKAQREIARKRFMPCLGHTSNSAEARAFDRAEWESKQDASQAASGRTDVVQGLPLGLIATHQVHHTRVVRDEYRTLLPIENEFHDRLYVLGRGHSICRALPQISVGPRVRIDQLKISLLFLCQPESGLMPCHISHRS